MLTVKIYSKILRTRKWKQLKKYSTFNTDIFTVHPQKKIVKILPERWEKCKIFRSFAEKFLVSMLDAKGPGIRDSLV